MVPAQEPGGSPGQEPGESKEREQRKGGGGKGGGQWSFTTAHKSMLVFRDYLDITGL